MENAPGDVTRRATPAFNLEAGALALRESELILGARESECAKKRDQVGPQWFLSQRDRRRCDAGPVTGTAAAARAEFKFFKASLFGHVIYGRDVRFRKCTFSAPVQRRNVPCPQLN